MKYLPKKRKQAHLLSNIFPLCQRILHEKINRTNFTGAKWRSSTKSSVLSFNPVNCGWVIEGGKYRINWYTGPEALTVLDVTITEELDEDEKHMFT